MQQLKANKFQKETDTKIFLNYSNNGKIDEKMHKCRDRYLTTENNKNQNHKTTPQPSPTLRVAEAEIKTIHKNTKRKRNNNTE